MKEYLIFLSFVLIMVTAAFFYQKAYAVSPLVKINKGTVICEKSSHINGLVQAFKHQDQEIIDAYIDFILEKQYCGLSKDNFFGHMKDIDRHAVRVDLIAPKVTVWTLKSQILN